jgi:hypothetical protein
MHPFTRGHAPRQPPSTTPHQHFLACPSGTLSFGDRLQHVSFLYDTVFSVAFGMGGSHPVLWFTIMSALHWERRFLHLRFDSTVIYPT